MATTWNVREINYNKDTKDSFRELIEKVNTDKSPKNPEARKFFLDNLREFSLWDKPYTLVLWEFINPDKSETEFEKELIATEPKKSEVVKAELVKARDKYIQVYTLDFTAFMDEFFPPSKIIHDSFYNRDEVIYPRRAKELDLSQEEVNKLTSNKIVRASGMDSNISISVDLTGKLDLSEWENLETLNISRNVSLEKIDLSRNKRLKEVFMNSSPYITEVRGKQMSLDKLVLGDDKYETLTIFMMYGSLGDKTNANYLKLNQDHQLTFFLTSSADINHWWDIQYDDGDIKWINTVKVSGKPDTIRFVFSPTRTLVKEIEWIFEHFEDKAPQDIYELKGSFERFIWHVGGGDNNQKIRRKFVRKEKDENTGKEYTVWGDLEEGEMFDPNRGDIEYDLHDGDIQLASRLWTLLRNPPPKRKSWKAFSIYLRNDILGVNPPGISTEEERKKYKQQVFEKKFKGLPSAKVEAIIASLYNAIKRTVEMNEDARKNYTAKDIVKGVEEDYKDIVRGEEKKIKLYMPKRETTDNERKSGMGFFTDEEWEYLVNKEIFKEIISKTYPNLPNYSD